MGQRPAISYSIARVSLKGTLYCTKLERNLLIIKGEGKCDQKCLVSYSPQWQHCF